MELKKLNLDAPSGTKTKTVSTTQINPLIKFVPLILVLVLGLATGYFIKAQAPTPTRSSGPIIARNVPETGLKEGDIIGIQDIKSFKDSSTGVLQSGGLDGEGSHRLLRPGGASQTVYLTSSVIDLDAFVGHQVTIWGETFKGQKAGWLMDVGRVKVEKLNAPNPN